jgi:hypothetical protein
MDQFSQVRPVVDEGDLLIDKPDNSKMWVYFQRSRSRISYSSDGNRQQKQYVKSEPNDKQSTI